MGLFFRKPGIAANAFFRWLPVAIAASGCAMLAYVATQQAIRLNADDPQVAMAEYEAGVLGKGAPLPGPQGEQADIATSLAPFLVVYDLSGTPLASTGLLDGKPPVPPVGILEASKRSGENRVTWQPRPGLRIAAVVVPVPSGNKAGYVLAGRSLRESERRTDLIGKDILIGWFVTALASFAASYFAARREAG